MLVSEGQRGGENWPSPETGGQAMAGALGTPLLAPRLLTSAVSASLPNGTVEGCDCSEDVRPQPPCPNSLPKPLSPSGPLNSLNLWPHQPYPPQGQAQMETDRWAAVWRQRKTKAPGDFCPIFGQSTESNLGPGLQSQGRTSSLLAKGIHPCPLKSPWAANCSHTCPLSVCSQD